MNHDFFSSLLVVIFPASLIVGVGDWPGRSVQDRDEPPFKIMSTRLYLALTMAMAGLFPNGQPACPFPLKHLRFKRYSRNMRVIVIVIVFVDTIIPRFCRLGFIASGNKQDQHTRPTASDRSGNAPSK